MNNSDIKLTEYSRSAGCSCKIAPAVLQQILANTTDAFVDPNVLVGNKNADDASVYDIGNGQVIVSTADFFMPIVNDAYNYGAIAAANALSDVYAMGAKPAVALAILGWPLEKLGADLASQVIQGAKDICASVDVQISGGHTIDSAEPFFGLSATAVADKQHIRSNNLAQAGDAIYLTKPLGLGILSAGHKRGKNTEAQNEVMLKHMLQVNSLGYQMAALPYVRTMTDVTGFGLVGHLLEVCKASRISATINYSELPLIAEAKELQQAGINPDATFRNWGAYSADISMDPAVPVMEAFTFLPDPQTNGGLLVFVAAENTATFEAWYAQQTGINLRPIGTAISSSEKVVTVLP
jgi:selenide, water dikinase